MLLSLSKFQSLINMIIAFAHAKGSIKANSLTLHIFTTLLDHDICYSYLKIINCWLKVKIMKKIRVSFLCGKESAIYTNVKSNYKMRKMYSFCRVPITVVKLQPI